MKNFSLKKIIVLVVLTISAQGIFSQIKKNILTPEQFDEVSINDITFNQIYSTNGALIPLKNLLGNDITVDYEVNDIDNSVFVKWGAVCILFTNEDDNLNQLDYLPEARYWVSNITIEKTNEPKPNIKITNKSFKLSDAPSVLHPYELSENRGKKFFLFSLAELPNITIGVRLNESGTAIEKFTYNEY